ncbi:MAG: PEP-CTERM sorting domain-containing protein [Acidobacteria bacterium]|nr:PEP-CTERM sorting domain-containing protein [Acidobacteriota bacterium]
MSSLPTAVTRLRRVVVCLLMWAVAAQTALADTITYRQLQQDQSRQLGTVASTPKVVRTVEPQTQAQDQSQKGQQQAGVAQESSTHPEFVRLPDGRIVRYGPGIVCEENCVEPIAPAAFRGPGPAFWWIIPPIVAGGILCAVLCRPDRDNNPQPTPTIVIPPPSPQPTATLAPSPTPPPTQIPEPSTLLLFGAGLGALLARKRLAAKKERR